MANPFTQMILFQVKPEKLTEFELLVQSIKPQLESQQGCISVKYVKRLYTFDGVENGDPPRELSKIVKCVKYYLIWEFDTIENCGMANGRFFENHAKSIMKLLIMPFEINSGYLL